MRVTLKYCKLQVLLLMACLLQEASHRGVWLDYVLVIPAEQYSGNVLSEEPVDNTGTFIKECGHNHFFMDNFTEGRVLVAS
jgi:laminin alpha 3/5